MSYNAPESQKVPPQVALTLQLQRVANAVVKAKKVDINRLFNINDISTL